jgi:AcrR family transcriptional regulator
VTRLRARETRALRAGERRHKARELKPDARLAEMQRSRLLAAAVGAIEEHGYAQTTVAQITARSRVSRRTFYELFEDREQCLAALLEDVVAMVQGELAAAGLEGLPWRERVRGGLEAILVFCDREPALARVFVVHALRGGPEVLERREDVLARLVAVLDEGRAEGSRANDRSPLTAEGLVGAALGILHARLTRRKRTSLVNLSGELMGMIVLPYLGSAATRRELARPPQTPVAPAHRHTAERVLSESDPLQGVPMRLTYRTACVLQVIAAQSGVSNREVAEQAGISDQGQISKLLARLERLELCERTGSSHQKGEANSWELTALGQQVAQQLRVRGA